MNVVWGIAKAMISSLHNNFHLLETEENPLKSECVCLCGGVIENWQNTLSSHPIWVILGVFSPGTLTTTTIQGLRIRLAFWLYPWSNSNCIDVKQHHERLDKHAPLNLKLGIRK